MEKKCLVIEDNSTQRKRIKQLLRETSGDVKIYDVDNLQDAYKIMLENQIDLFVVDIVLDTDRRGDLSGVKLVSILRSIPQYRFTPVIFITSLEDPKLYAYSSLHCFGYLEKPFNRGDAKKLFHNALGYIAPKFENDILCMRKDGVLYPFKIDRIVYIESRNRLIKIHWDDGSTEDMPYMTCQQLLEEANNSSLLQCSRGVIVNKDYVKVVDKLNHTLELKGFPERLEIGVAYVAQVLKELSD